MIKINKTHKTNNFTAFLNYSATQILISKENPAV